MHNLFVYNIYYTSTNTVRCMSKWYMYIYSTSININSYKHICILYHISK